MEPAERRSRQKVWILSSEKGKNSQKIQEKIIQISIFLSSSVRSDSVIDTFTDYSYFGQDCQTWSIFHLQIDRAKISFFPLEWSFYSFVDDSSPKSTTQRAWLTQPSKKFASSNSETGETQRRRSGTASLKSTKICPKKQKKPKRW